MHECEPADVSVSSRMDAIDEHARPAAVEDALNDKQAVADPFRLAIDTIPGLAWSALPDGRIDFVNRRWQEYTGLTLDKAGGWGWRATIHPEDLPDLERYWQSLIASGEPGEQEIRLRRADGAYRWFLCRAAPLYDAGTVVKWHGQTTDIDDRKQAEQRLRRSEAYLAEAQTLSQTGSFGWIVATGELFWSAETYCILGYDETVKPTLEHVFTRVHPEDVGRVRQTVERASREGTKLDFEHRLLMPDGAVKHVHCLAGPAKDVSGNLEFVGAVMDITERKQAAEALRASEQVARSQIEALKYALDALALDAAPDRLTQHLSRAITEQLGAHSASVWRRNETNGLVGFEFAYEGGRFVTKADSLIAGRALWLPMDDSWPWPKPLRSGEHCYLADIREVPPFPLRDRLVAMGVITVLMVPMLLAGRLEGAIAVRFLHQRALRPEEIDFAKTLANQAVLAMQLARLSAQSRDAAVLAERNRMARDIHDTLAQGFTGVIVQLEAAEDARSRGLSREADEHAARARDLARGSLGEARRSVQALRPQALEESDLCEALDSLFTKTTAGTNVRAEFVVSGVPKSLPPDWEDDLLHIGQEALTNALRHASAKRFTAQVTFASDMVRMDLRDDGEGFDLSAKSDGFGLLGMRDRVARMGGQLTIQSAPGEGTGVSIAIPIIGRSALATG